MTPFFVYLIKSSVSLALLYSLFRLVMRNDRMHTLNRFLLLGILLFSAVIPFLNIQFFTKEVPVQQVEKIREFISIPVFAPETTVAENLPAEEAGNFAFNPYLIFYAGIILVLLTHLIISVIRVLQLIKNAQKQRFQNLILAIVKDFIQPFTFLDRIVLSEKDFNENKDMVVAHEHAHIKYWHAVDLVVCELFTLLHFFNPFMWLLRHDLKMIHEYQADQAVLNKGIDAQKYQLLVLEKAVGERRFALANHFTQKPILKRFKMMKKRKRPWARVKLLFFAPVLILLFQAFARPELITKPDDFVPVKYTENKTEQRLQKWTVDESKTVKPPPPPPPVKINLKNNGEIVVGKNGYKTFSAFQNKLLEMHNTIEKINRSHGTKYTYKTTLAVEDAVANSEINRVIQALENADFNKSNIVVIKDDKPATKNTTPSSSSQTASEKVDVHLNQNKIYFEGKFCKTEDLKSTVEKYLAENPDVKMVRLILHQPDDLSSDMVAKAKEELNKIKNVEIKVISVEVLNIVDIKKKKNPPPPPPPPKFVVELDNSKIKVNGKEISEKELGNAAIDFLMKAGDKYSVHFDVAGNVSNERVQQIRERLFFAGMSLNNFTCYTKN